MSAFSPEIPAPEEEPDDLGSRAPSEFADLAPRLRRLSELSADDPDRAALRGELIRTFLPLADRLAARYAGRRHALAEDLRQVASLGVINAVDRWDAGRAEGDVLGYVVPCVRGEILRYFRDRTWALRVPRRLKELGVAIRQTTGPLTQELGRAPRPSELAARLGASIDEIVDALQAEASHEPAALDATYGEDGATLVDRLPDPDDSLGSVDDVAAVRSMLSRLPERERRILILRFYGDRTQSQIAAEIGVSQMHVSRLLARILADLRVEMLADD